MVFVIFKNVLDDDEKRIHIPSQNKWTIKTFWYESWTHATKKEKIPNVT